MKRGLKIAQIASVLAVMTHGGWSWAGDPRLFFSVGNYNYSVKSAVTSSGSSGFAQYQLCFGYTFLDQLMVYVGTTMILAQVISGDTGFGADAGVRYYPLTGAGIQKSSLQTTEVIWWERYRPFAGLSMRQRTFQSSNQASYVGFGVFLGVEHQIFRRWDWFAQGNYDLFSGPSKTSATQINFQLGVGFHI